MNKRYGIVIDLERCIGCHTCQIACNMEHNLESVSGIRVDTVGGKYPDTPSGKYPNLSMHYRPVPCMHCGNPSCLDACPVEAISKRKDGIVFIDEEECTGCQLCMEACPYDVIFFDPKSNVAQKCTLCMHRIDQGLEPFCVVCCEDNAMFYGDLNDPDSNVSRLIIKKSASTFNPEAGTEPAIYYCPVAPKIECTVKC